MAETWHELGTCCLRNGHLPQAEAAYRHALTLQQGLFDELPQAEDVRASLIQLHDQLAWFLCIRPDRRPQQALEALEHAQKAVAMQPGYHDWWHTLGVAHCRLGHWKEALDSIEKSRQLAGQKGPLDAYDAFFEAIAYWGLGDKNNARRCYGEGMRWRIEHAPDHPDLRRFQVEAAALLGIDTAVNKATN